MRKRPKQPKWVKALKRKIRTSSYLVESSYDYFAKSLGISTEKLKEYWNETNHCN